MPYVFKNNRPAYPNELWHHGIKGQHWGVKNGPPYPLSRGKESIRYKVNKESVENIFDSLSDSEKIHLAGQAGNPTVPKHYAQSDDEWGPKSSIVDGLTIYKGKLPVAFCALYVNGPGRAEVSIATRGGDSYRHKGYASKALEEGIALWRDNPNLNELDYYPHADNKASIALAKKFGFKEFERNTYFVGLALYK